jgi:hypothetical protein
MVKEDDFMNADDLIYSEDLRHRLMDIIKCANDEYLQLAKGDSEDRSLSKADLQEREYSVRRRLYSVLLDAFGVENESRVEDSFVEYVSSFSGTLGYLIEEAGLDSEAKKVLAASLATCIAAAAEDGRDVMSR